MPFTFLIRVRYPVAAGRIILRTDSDWDRDVEPVRVSIDRTTWEFERTLDDCFFYFKPCLIDGDRFQWSQGTDYLASLDSLRDTGGREIYPAFYSSDRGALTDRLEVRDAATGDTRSIRVYLPPGYSENTLKRYPVLYMHDGTNLFFPEESFLGVEWGVDDTLDLLDAMNVIDKVVVVGIYANQRQTEYTQPGYEGYGRFIVSDLKPWIDARARTLDGPGRTAVMGSSLGGVVSFYLAWQHPEVFGMAGCLSSTFTWHDDLMARVGREARRDVRFYLDSGWPGDNFEVTRSMRDLLLLRGYTEGQDVLYLSWPHHLHNEQYWAARLHVPFQFFFRKTPVFPADPALRTLSPARVGPTGDR